jgi:hypothetical protein
MAYPASWALTILPDSTSTGLQIPAFLKGTGFSGCYLAWAKMQQKAASGSLSSALMVLRDTPVFLSSITALFISCQNGTYSKRDKSFSRKMNFGIQQAENPRNPSHQSQVCSTNRKGATVPERPINF